MYCLPSTKNNSWCQGRSHLHHVCVNQQVLLGAYYQSSINLIFFSNIGYTVWAILGSNAGSSPAKVRGSTLIFSSTYRDKIVKHIGTCLLLQEC